MTSNGRWQRGAGRVAIERIQYPIDIALKQLETVKNLILLGTKVPVAFLHIQISQASLFPIVARFFRWLV